MNVPRRSPPCSHPFAPCGAPGRVHLSCSASVFIFRRSRRVHSIGSQSTGSRFRVTFRREEASIAFRPSRLHPHPAITLVLVFRRSRPPCRTAFAFRLRLSTPPFRVRRTMTSFRHAHLSIYTLDFSHRCACVSSALRDRLPLATEASTTCPHLAMRIDCFLSGAVIAAHLSTLTILRHFRAHARARFVLLPRLRGKHVTHVSGLHLAASSTLRHRPEHTHCARSYSAYCHRESLACSSPIKPPCSSF